MHRAIAIVAVGALATGCVSGQMKKLVGLPIQEAAIEYGAPINVVDMPDGRRVFQFASSRTVHTPVQAQTQGSGFGNSYQANTTVYGGNPVQINCTYTFYTTWNESASTWMVTDFKAPDRLIC